MADGRTGNGGEHAPTAADARRLAKTVRDEGFGALADWLEDNAHVLENDPGDG